MSVLPQPLPLRFRIGLRRRSGTLGSAWTQPLAIAGMVNAGAAVTRQPNMRVLYTSGYTPQSIAHLDLEGSQTAFLPKPFSASELAQHVRRLLDL